MIPELQEFHVKTATVMTLSHVLGQLKAIMAKLEMTDHVDYECCLRCMLI
jgi:hypothetical protein